MAHLSLAGHITAKSQNNTVGWAHHALGADTYFVKARADSVSIGWLLSRKQQSLSGFSQGAGELLSGEGDLTVKAWPEQCEEAIQKLGRDFGLLFVNLVAQLHDVQWKWNEYVVLFGTSESRIKILNDSAPRFFAHLQDVLFADTVIHIARLTDRDKSAGQPNLSINALEQHIKDPTRKQELKSLVVEAVSAAEFCTEWRNKRIAHADLAHFTAEPPTQLKLATREKIGISIEKIRVVLDWVSTLHTDVGVNSISPVEYGGAQDLLCALNRANRFERERQGRIDRGQYLPGDLDHEDV